MSDFSLLLTLTVAITFLLAGIVKGVTGMGLPTLAMGLLGTIMPPVTAASLLIVPSFVTNVWQLFAGPSFSAILRRLWLMMAGILIGTIAGSRLLASDNVKWTTAGLGAALIVYAAYSLLARQPVVPAKAERWSSPFVGFLTGLVTGGTGVFVVPAVPYIQALGLSRDDLIQALGLSFTVSTIALALGLASHGAFEAGYLALSSLAVLPALLGMWLGQALRQKISPATFRRWFLIFLVLLGVELLLRPFLA
ncbi:MULTISPECIES: sulfite exporter TauE/SafE family protein [unclassified Mesorhizobium]|uniref:sulfite exporter TauE/SafE family protein n=1 Tax=unclassified Mesorhizobium TaxID=325217 RepID=UPI00112DFC14|nr:MULTISPECIES: sulfite exporter TauE/SafE family protein [unclassified Mesorhizobium]TPL04707.1 sulfite exporter TauE/SafE family protein [Mesorhizobium sp. B2-4-16]TPL76828.1 sulfite exporter TauE/SafE family protein [Mesorhizobium sp. B2-4-3]